MGKRGKKGGNGEKRQSTIDKKSEVKRIRRKKEKKMTQQEVTSDK